MLNSAVHQAVGLCSKSCGQARVVARPPSDLNTSSSLQRCRAELNSKFRHLLGSISGGPEKTHRTLRSRISDIKSLIASKFGSFVVQYVLLEYAKLHLCCFRNVFLLTILVPYVENHNIKTAVNLCAF